MDEAYLDFVKKFLSVIDFAASIITLKVKSNSKPWFDIHVLNAIQNRDKYYKNFKRSGKEIHKGNLKCKKLLFKKIVNNKKKLYCRE